MVRPWARRVRIVEGFGFNCYGKAPMHMQLTGNAAAVKAGRALDPTRDTAPAFGPATLALLLTPGSEWRLDDLLTPADSPAPDFLRPQAAKRKAKGEEEAGEGGGDDEGDDEEDEDEEEDDLDEEDDDVEDDEDEEDDDEEDEEEDEFDDPDEDDDDFDDDDEEFEDDDE